MTREITRESLLAYCDGNPRTMTEIIQRWQRSNTQSRIRNVVESAMCDRKLINVSRTRRAAYLTGTPAEPYRFGPLLSAWSRMHNRGANR